jgi:P27 family predicted phage terminase small subunit
MGKRGPKPAPISLKIQSGMRSDRVNRAAPSPPAVEPEPPAELSALAKGEWDRITPILTRMRVLTEADGAALALYCETFATWTETAKKIARQGYVVLSAAATAKVNPLVAINAQARADMLRLLSEFGLTPSSRSRVSVTSDSEVDPIAEFLRKRNA